MTAWEQINAYVDGELGATSAADVADEIARDPQVAARVATLHRLKAVTQSVGSFSKHLPLPAIPIEAKVERSWFPRRAIAASLVVALCAGFVWLLLPSKESAQHTTLISADQIIDAHLAWLSSSDPARESVLAPTPTNLTAPNLLIAGLKLTHQSRDVVVSGDALYGYVGLHGCRLGLWTGPTLEGFEGLTSEPRQQPSRVGVDAYLWQDGAATYAVTAKGMDPGRLKRLAGVISVLLRRGQVPGEVEQIALRALADDAKPCHA